MPISKEINREAIRLLAIEHGVREAARMTGLNEDRVRQWSSRFSWFEAKTPHHNQAVTNVTTSPADAHLHELARLEGETRTSLARSAAQLARQGENAKLEASGHVRNAAQVAQIAFKWRDDEKPTYFTLNQLNINTLSIDETPTLDG